MATCELARLQLNIRGRWAAERVYAALFHASVGALLLWAWRPAALESAPRPPRFRFTGTWGRRHRPVRSSRYNTACSSWDALRASGSPTPAGFHRTQ